MNRKIAWPFALLCAFFALLFATSASPLYATNFWTDTNVYFTIGRGMLQGAMPYRDLFDHKGPLLYLIYALGAGIADQRFVGVFLLEVLSLAALLHIVQRLAWDQGARAASYALVPLLALITCTSRAFTQGGSAEEFCLPLLAASIFLAGRAMETGASRPCLGFGAALGAVFLIKYTDIGLFLGLAPFVLLCVARRHAPSAALRCLGAMALGLLIPILVLGLWLFAAGILDDCLRVYFLQNLSYAGTPMSLRGHLFNALAYLRTQSRANPALALLSAAGLALGFLDALRRGGKGASAEALALPSGAGLLLLTCYWGEMAHPYYALVFAATAGAGLARFAALADRLMHARVPLAPRAGLAAALCLSLLPLCARLCPAGALRAVRREEMAQTIFAREMHRLSSHPSLLDYSSLDQGFYLAANILPECRYFADNNLETAEKRRTLDAWLSEARSEFVVTVWKSPGEAYEPILTHESPFDLGELRPYTLWRRKPTTTEHERGTL